MVFPALRAWRIPFVDNVIQGAMLKYGLRGGCWFVLSGVPVLYGMTFFMDAEYANAFLSRLIQIIVSAMAPQRALPWGLEPVLGSGSALAWGSARVSRD